MVAHATIAGDRKLPRRAIAALVLLCLAGYVVWPQLVTFGRAMTPQPGADGSVFQQAADTLGSPLNRAAVRHSVVLTLVSTALAAVLGVTVAWLHERYRFRGRTLLLLGAVAPLTLPPIVGVMAFVRLVGYGGIIPRVLSAITGVAPTAFVLQDYPGILLVHAYSFSVYFFVLTRAGLASIDPSLELAARSLGAGTWRRLRTAVLPVMLPFWTSASLLSFMISMGSFSAPKYMTSGKPYLPILTVEIAYHYSNGDFRTAALLSAVLSLICLGVLALLLGGLGGGWRRDSGGAKGTHALPTSHTVENATSRALAASGSVLFFVLMLLPPALILLTSFADMKAWIEATTILPPSLTFDNWRSIFTTRGAYTHPIVVSATAAGAATLLNVVVGVASAWLIARGGRLLRTGIELASMLPLALPGTVVAFNLVIALGGRGGSILTLGTGLRNTLTILVLAYFVRQIPLALRPLQASAARLDAQLEAAARSLGAGPTRTFRSIVLPQLRNGILATALICLVTGLGEFVASVLVSSTRWTPISIEISTALADSDGLGPACAYAALLMIATTVVLAIYQRLTTDE